MEAGFSLPMGQPILGLLFLPLAWQLEGTWKISFLLQAPHVGCHGNVEERVTNYFRLHRTHFNWILAASIVGGTESVFAMGQAKSRGAIEGNCPALVGF